MTQANGSFHKCPGCRINAKTVDDAAWEAALEIIHNPSKVDEALEEQKSKDPTASRRKETKKKLAELEKEREGLETELLRLIKERKLTRRTEDRLTNELKELEQLEYQYNSELLDDDKIRREWEKTQRDLERLHKKCATMREKLKDLTYTPDYKDKRDMIEFFGITAILWEEGHVNPQTDKPERGKIQAKFSDIEFYLSRELTYAKINRYRGTHRYGTLRSTGKF
jgi:predicted RNase H-like nuclease (RuvC/YqgF family)